MNSVSNFTVLNTYLQPLEEILAQEGVAEISINEPEKGWVEKFGKMYSVSLPVFTYKHLYGLAKLIAQSTDQIVSEEKPLLSATLPNGCRVQVILPPVCPKGTVFADSWNYQTVSSAFYVCNTDAYCIESVSSAELNKEFTNNMSK